MLYTVGDEKDYRRYRAEFGVVRKAIGGSVWPSAVEAQVHCGSGQVVFGVVAELSDTVHVVQGGVLGSHEPLELNRAAEIIFPPVDPEGSVRGVMDGFSRCWYDREWRLHRADGPAVEGVNGFKCWMRHGERHRKDGPAFEHPDGLRSWYQNDLLSSERPT